MKFVALEAKYDSQFKAVFDAIRQLMNPPPLDRVSSQRIKRGLLDGTPRFFCFQN